MSSHIRRVRWNTRERALTSDLNDASALLHRALVEALRRVESGDAAQSGVLGGFTASADGATMNITIAPGLALLRQTAPTYLDSDWTWVESASVQSIDLTALADPAQPRWVAIELEPAEAVELSTARDIWVPANSTFLSQNVVKLSGSSPQLIATPGAAQATPVLPAGTPGRIPLAYVRLGAAATSIAVTDVVACRPLLVEPLRGDAMVQGGGVEVDTVGSDNVRLIATQGTFRNGLDFEISTRTLADHVLTTGASSSGIYPPANQGPVYLYAVPATLLYPAGYDAHLGPREFRVSGAGAGHFTGGVSASYRNCVVIASDIAPTVRSISGAPSSGDFDITIATFGAATVPRNQTVYLGAVTHGGGVNGLNSQGVRGDAVYPASFDLLLNTMASPASLWRDLGGNPLLPTTATQVHCTIRLRVDSGESASIEVEDVVGGMVRDALAVDALVSASLRAHTAWFAPAGTTGNVTFTVGGTALEQVVRVLGYRDAVLALR